MSEISTQAVQDALRDVIEPASGRDIVSLGMVSGIMAREGTVGFVLTIEPKDKQRLAELREQSEQAVKKLPGVKEVMAVLTAQSKQAPDQTKQRANWNLTPVEGVKHLIAVASGKGGVGKSTTAVNLAWAMQSLGLKVGLLDADIYGPSLPRMVGLQGAEKPPMEKDKILPPHKDGLPVMSMGFLMGEGAAIWRGPMLTKALQQMLRGVAWGELDVLVIDMPPGTGDVHISMVQQVPISGALLVTTPQEVAVMDARKCADMFDKAEVPVLGIIENMSYFADPSGARHTLFGEGGGKALAEFTRAPLLGQLPLDTAIGQAAEAGDAYPLSQPQSEAALAYRRMAGLVMEMLEEQDFAAQQAKA